MTAVDLGTLALAGTTLVALGATLLAPPAYEKYLRRRAHRRILARALAMHSFPAPLPTVPSLGRLLAEARTRSKAAASLVIPPTPGLPRQHQSHRRAD